MIKIGSGLALTVKLFLALHYRSKYNVSRGEVKLSSRINEFFFRGHNPIKNQADANQWISPGPSPQPGGSNPKRREISEDAGQGQSGPGL